VETWNTSLEAISYLRGRGNRRIFKNYEIVAREFARRIAARRGTVTFCEPTLANQEPYRMRMGWRGRRAH